MSDGRNAWLIIKGAIIFVASNSNIYMVEDIQNIYYEMFNCSIKKTFEIKKYIDRIVVIIYHNHSPVVYAILTYA